LYIMVSLSKEGNPKADKISVNIIHHNVNVAEPEPFDLTQVKLKKVPMPQQVCTVYVDILCVADSK